MGTSAGARRGLLIRGGDVLEAASHIDTVVLDKTGTLTVGKPQVTHVHSLVPLELLMGGEVVAGDCSRSGSPADVVLQLAAAAERRTTHPIAQALVHAADQLHSLPPPQQQQPLAAAAADEIPSSSSASSPVDGGRPALDLSLQDGSFVQEPGTGVAATVGGRRVAVGTLEWLQRQGADVAAAEAALAMYGTAARAATETVVPDDLGFLQPTAAAAPANVQGVGNSHTRVYVSVDGAVAGVIDVADAVRPDARATVDRLHRQGIRTVMLSGDKPAAAAEVAAAVGISPNDVFADVKPAGKKAVVEELRAAGRVVAMVGDGINDTAALAAADVGVAMGGGVDAASEVANVVLLGDQLSQVGPIGRF